MSTKKEINKFKSDSGIRNEEISHILKAIMADVARLDKHDTFEPWLLKLDNFIANLKLMLDREEIEDLEENIQ